LTRNKPKIEVHRHEEMLSGIEFESGTTNFPGRKTVSKSRINSHNHEDLITFSIPSVVKGYCPNRGSKKKKRI
jgi:hypothetical protein